MFIRKTRKIHRQTKREYFLYQLVESYRTERGPRQRILLNMGSDIPVSSDSLKLLANCIEELVSGAPSFFKYPDNIGKLARTYANRLIRSNACAEIENFCGSSQEKENDYQMVDVSTLEHEQSRTIGAEYIALETIRKLKLDKKLLEVGLKKKQVDLALGVIVGRLVCPGSDLNTHHWLQNISGLGDLLETDFQDGSLSSVYRVTDLIFKKKEALESHLASTEKELFSFDNTIFLYDLTNTYLEGSGKLNPKALRGRSKEKRTDCPLVTMGLVLNTEGFPQKSDIFPGNVSETGTLKNAIDRLSSNQEKNPVIVLDAGLSTEENLSWLRSNNYHYIVSSRKKITEIPDSLKFETIRECKDSTIKAATVSDDQTGEVTVYCQSEGRKEKEQSMRSSFQERFETSLESLKRGLSKKRGIKTTQKISEKIGRLKEKHKRISYFYDIEIVTGDDPEKVTDISWKIQEHKLKDKFQGFYALRSFGLEWTSKELWNTYVMLTNVEDSFRCMKSDLGLRPIFHQIDDRVDAHLFITLLAYHVMQTIRYELQEKNLNISWKILCQRMSTQVRVTTSACLKSGKYLHVRSSTKPESFHREVYQALNLPTQPGRRIRSII